MNPAEQKANIKFFRAKMSLLIFSFFFLEKIESKISREQKQNSIVFLAKEKR